MLDDTGIFHVPLPETCFLSPSILKKITGAVTGKYGSDDVSIGALTLGPFGVSGHFWDPTELPWDLGHFFFWRRLEGFGASLKGTLTVRCEGLEVYYSLGVPSMVMWV